jgi:tetratricopeptide (TPR) repeat protein
VGQIQKVLDSILGPFFVLCVYKVWHFDCFNKKCVERKARIADRAHDLTGGRMQDQTTTYYQQAVEFFKNKKYKDAFLKLINVSNQMSHDVDFLFLLSEVQKELQDFSARQKTLKVLTSVNPKIEHQLLYMRQLMQNKCINLALDTGLLMQTDTHLSLQQKTELFDLLSQIYIQENDFEGLSEIIQSYRAENILTEQYYYSQSLLCLNQHNEMTALDHLRQAVLKNHHFDQGWVALALLHDKMGDQELSMANLEKALDANPLNASALKHYSKKSIQSGSVDKAVEKINFYMDHHNFDTEMSSHYAELMKCKNQNDVVQRESEKLSYYFGQQISL